MMKKRISTFLFFTMIFLSLNAQKSRVGLLDGSGLVISPTLLTDEMYEKSLKLQLINRNQYYNNPIGSNYKFAAVGYSFKAFAVGLSYDKFIGNLNGLSLNELRTYFNYSKKLNNSSKLVVGLNYNAPDISIEVSDFNFADQFYTGGKTLENFEQESWKVRNNFGAGLQFNKTIRTHFNFRSGIAIDNILADKTIVRADLFYPREYFLYFFSELPIKDKISASSNTSVSIEGSGKELVSQLGINFYLKNESRVTLMIGARNFKEYSGYFKLKIQNVSVSMGYQNTVKRVNTATASFPSLNLNINYVLHLKKRDRVKRIKRISEPEPELEEEIVEEEPLPIVAGNIDTDQDGIADNIDRCPKIFGYLENGGCPYQRFDVDGDGIPNDKDDCPYIKGYGGAGCPDYDKDGLSDIVDECPFLYGEMENKGCPQFSFDKYGELVNNQFKSVIIYFDTNDATVKKSGFYKLKSIDFDKVEQIMIVGHTDNEGNEQENYLLGIRRAENVKNILSLVTNDNIKMEMKSYGELKPQDSNNTLIGKAKNRRCEIIILYEK